MGIKREGIEAVDSFKSCWHALRKHCRRVAAGHPLTAEEEREFLKTRDAMLERSRRLQSLTGEDGGLELPQSLAKSLEGLGGYQSLSSLSDARLEDFNRLSKDADREINIWLTGLRRRSIQENALEREARTKFFNRFITLPALFAVLLAVLVATGIFFFLKR